MNIDRLKLLEQKVQVMQTEIADLVGEIQRTIEGLSKGTYFGIQGLSARLDKLETATKTAEPVKELASEVEL